MTEPKVPLYTYASDTFKIAYIHKFKTILDKLETKQGTILQNK